MRKVRSHVARSATVLVLAGSLVTAAAATGAASPSANHHPSPATPVVLTCGGQDVARPTSITTTCADGYTYFQPIKWHSWGGTRATASTRFHENPCTPTCFASRDVSYKATLSLSGLITAHGKRFYTKLRASYSVGRKQYGYSFTLLTQI